MLDTVNAFGKQKDLQQAFPICTPADRVDQRQNTFDGNFNYSPACPTWMEMTGGAERCQCPSENLEDCNLLSLGCTAETEDWESNC
jgi:hypothetical protein